MLKDSYPELHTCAALQGLKVDMMANQNESQVFLAGTLA